MSSNHHSIALAGRTTQARDALQENDQVIQFFQAALTGRLNGLELTQEEAQGLFTLMEWQRSNLRGIAAMLVGNEEDDRRS